MDNGQLIKEMNNLNQLVLDMGDRVENTIHVTFSTLMKGDIDNADKIIKDDYLIDRQALKISEECLKLLALYQPVASDLRFITTALSIVTDLERIGDLAVDVANRIKELGNGSNIEPIDDLAKIVVIVERMMRQSLSSYVRRDASQSKEVITLKMEAIKLLDIVNEEILAFAKQNTNNIKNSISFALLGYHVERIACHVTNIAEDVVYMVDAELIKYQNKN
ncbi:phosphate transport system regulatory protein PhoU [Candidatus Roizmanbacteria bacterium RIFCSPLOWO2_02_FULL_38_10]|uniref:Phosphate-specific transport system accessory protein PhoU n=1 Tax=Candidatus Roizmanbacteria bacterium RIFCSPLOWO2_02_FULL_38_10 TaxID=1802074 RepID=A0A1F7JM63_9BACT|nr:MAG: phosphate transport system regulatory protein PhoU [Candidatus Roizmanbacteria bacterium RIFCSPLOWO2_02_FULL_38_10]